MSSSMKLSGLSAVILADETHGPVGKAPRRDRPCIENYVVGVARILEDAGKGFGDRLAVALELLCEMRLVEQQRAGYAVGHVVTPERFENALQVCAQMRIVRPMTAIFE